MVHRKIEWYNYHAILSSLCHSHRLVISIAQGDYREIWDFNLGIEPNFVKFGTPGLTKID